jgi:BirA family biotin operon repressor/biotin-[acetyl-CoA-carboxylase] ligase
LQPLLSTRWLGRAYDWHAACASTNDLVAARGREGAPEGLVVAADAQTGGRGRLGRSWHSPAGENLYFSILLRPERPPPEIPPLTLLAGAAVAVAVAGLGAAPRLKWPNDVLLANHSGTLEGRPNPPATTPLGKAELRQREAGVAPKVAGILTEMSSEGERVGQVVVGVGLNVNALDFPPELAARATSLRRALGRQLDRAEVLAAVLAAFEPLYDSFRAEGPPAAVDAWQRFAALGERWRVRSGAAAPLEGVALGVDPDGALRLRDDAGQIHRVLSGEIAP